MKLINVLDQIAKATKDIDEVENMVIKVNGEVIDIEAEIIEEEEKIYTEEDYEKELRENQFEMMIELLKGSFKDDITAVISKIEALLKSNKDWELLLNKIFIDVAVANNNSFYLKVVKR